MYNNAVDNKKIQIEIIMPSGFAGSMNESEIVKINALALLPYIKNDEITYGQAADLLGMDRLDLIEYYGEMGIPYVDYGAEELEAEVETLRRLRGEKR